MKKTSLLVAVPTVLLGALLIAGCGAFRSSKAWESAVQESPLEIPPGLDRPSTAEALSIPPRGANRPNANGAVAHLGGANDLVSDAFVLQVGQDAAWQRVGQALAAGDLGRVVGTDAEARVYTLEVEGAKAKKGWFRRHKKRSAEAAGTASGRVQVTVAGDATASEIRAQGGAAAVAKVVDALKARLGG